MGLQFSFDKGLNSQSNMLINGEKMVYCTNCGTQIADDAYFCSKCGVKTQKGKSANARYPTDQLSDAFYTVGVELEKAFNTAARETHAAVQKARENWQKSTEPQTVACPKCGSKNAVGSAFCINCGAKITST